MKEKRGDLSTADGGIDGNRETVKVEARSQHLLLILKSCFKQWFSTGVILPPLRGAFGNIRRHFWLSLLGEREEGGCYWQLVSKRPGVLLNSPQCTARNHPAPMSTVPRKRNPALETPPPGSPTGFDTPTASHILFASPLATPGEVEQVA